MTETQSQRRRLDQPAPEDVAGRKGCITIGAVLGVAVGALFAFLVMPRIFDHYFGTADIFLGESYRGDAKVMRLESVQRVPGEDGSEFPGLFEARFIVQTNKTWAPAPSEFTLALDIGTRVDGTAFADAPPGTAISLPLGVERELVVMFPGTERRDADPESVSIDEPDVRFHLEERPH